MSTAHAFAAQGASPPRLLTTTPGFKVRTHAGKTLGSLSYNFVGGRNYVDAITSVALDKLGMLRFKAKSAAPRQILIRITDHTGQTLQFFRSYSKVNHWQPMEVKLHNHWTTGVSAYSRLAVDVGKTIRRVAPHKLYIGPALAGSHNLQFLKTCFQAGTLGMITKFALFRQATSIFMRIEHIYSAIPVAEFSTLSFNNRMMPNHTEHLITLILAPVVLISACGLLCLTFYNRLAVLTARIRSFNAERFTLMEKISCDHSTPPHLNGKASPLQARQHGLEEQTQAILHRAYLIRRTLVCLVSCIIGMLLCSLTLGLGLIIPYLDLPALAFFVLGMFAMLVAMITALQELRLSLQPVSLEQDFFERIGTDSVNPLTTGKLDA